MSFVPTDGQITSLQLLNLPLTGGEVQEIVSPGNANAGNSFQVTTAVLAAFYAAFSFLNTETITAGATLASPYDVETTDTRILFNKTIGSASYALLPAAASMAYPFPVLFKDLKGDAATNNITINFTGGQRCDGLTQLVISNAYGWVEVNPVPGGTAWYLTSG